MNNWKTNITPRSAAPGSKTPKTVAAQTVSGSVKSASSHQCLRRRRLLCLLKRLNMLVAGLLLLEALRAPLLYSSMDLMGSLYHGLSNMRTGKVLLPRQPMRRLLTPYRVLPPNTLQPPSTLRATLNPSHISLILTASPRTDAGGMKNHIHRLSHRRILLTRHS